MDDIETLFVELAEYSDESVNKTINDMFNDDVVLGGLNASSIFILLMSEQSRIEGYETAHFDMESF